MAVSLFAVDKGYLDDVAMNKVVSFENTLQAFMRNQHKDLLDEVNKSCDYNDEIESRFHKALREFKETQ